MTSCSPMTGGVTAAAGAGESDTLTFGGTWATGDKWTVLFTDSATATQVQVGAGDITGLKPVYCFAYQNKVYFLVGPTVYCSAVGLPTTFNDPNATGNGFITFSDYYANSENLVAMATYQGKLAFFTRHTVQIYTISADLAQWQQSQVLENIGTFAPASVVPIGDLDVFFLSDTGIRSLRVRDSSLNAFVNDIGSPIDLDIQKQEVAATPLQLAASCSVVDPSANRYWCFLNDTIYAFSYFPSSKVLAWSTFQPTFLLAGVQTTFAPQKFLVYNGQVYALVATGGSRYVLLYGGTDNNTYDTCQALAVTPYLDGKDPGRTKLGTGLGAVMSGLWKIEAGMDVYSGIYNTVTTDSTATFDKGFVSYSGSGSHFSIRASTTAASGATLSMFAFYYNTAEEPA